MIKHTPGPWIVCVVDGEDRGYFSIEQDREALGGDEPSPIGEVYTSGEGIDMADGEANAALIAAAPDLLRYAQIVEEWESCRTKESQYDFTKRHGVENVRNVDLWLSYLRKDVIGKATAK